MKNFLKSINENFLGLLVCLGIALPSYFFGKLFPVIGGAVTAIVLGMIISLFWKNKGKASSGIKFTSKKNITMGCNPFGFWA